MSYSELLDISLVETHSKDNFCTCLEVSAGCWIERHQLRTKGTASHWQVAKIPSLNMKKLFQKPNAIPQTYQPSPAMLLSIRDYNGFSPQSEPASTYITPVRAKCHWSWKSDIPLMGNLPQHRETKVHKLFSDLCMTNKICISKVGNNLSGNAILQQMVGSKGMCFWNTLRLRSGTSYLSEI